MSYTLRIIPLLEFNLKKISSVCEIDNRQALFRSNSDKCFKPKAHPSSRKSQKGDKKQFTCVVCVDSFRFFFSLSLIATSLIRALQSSRDIKLGEYERDIAQRGTAMRNTFWCLKIFIFYPNCNYFSLGRCSHDGLLECSSSFGHISLVGLWWDLIAWTSWCCSGSGLTFLLWSWMMNN